MADSADHPSIDDPNTDDGSPDDATTGGPDIDDHAPDSAAEIEVAASSRGMPMWAAAVAGVIAVVALGLAIAASNSAREARDDLAGFQQQIYVSGAEAANTLNVTSSGLSVLADQPLVFTASVNQDVPIAASVPFNRQIVIPINTTIPINEVVETTIIVAGPLGLDIPVDVTVPIDLQIPVELSIPLAIDEVIEVDTSTRLDLRVPVEVDLEESGLADLVRQMSANLDRLAESIPVE